MRKFGCGAPPFEDTIFLGRDHVEQERWNLQKERARRGHNAKPTCQGCILFEYSYSGEPYIRLVESPNILVPYTDNLNFTQRCEHYIKGHSTDHLINFDVGRGLYDTDYLEALFLGDEDEVHRLEHEVFSVDDAGRALNSCDTVANSSSVKVCCRGCLS